MEGFVKDAVIAMSNEEFNFELKITPKLKLTEEGFAEKIKHSPEIMSMLRKYVRGLSFLTVEIEGSPVELIVQVQC